MVSLKTCSSCHSLSPEPGTTGCVNGVMSWRGQSGVAVISLNYRFHQPRRVAPQNALHSPNTISGSSCRRHLTWSHLNRPIQGRTDGASATCQRDQSPSRQHPGHRRLCERKSGVRVPRTRRRRASAPGRRARVARGSRIADREGSVSRYRLHVAQAVSQVPPFRRRRGRRSRGSGGEPFVPRHVMRRCPAGHTPASQAQGAVAQLVRAADS